MTLSLRPHEYRTDKRTGRNILTRMNPYVRLRNGDDPPVFLQGGKLYDEGGTEIKKAPPWVVEHMKVMSDKAKREVGFADDSSD
jgi:hypothetical protein